ncbi:hypothetical protein TSUD_170010 [Trifolium subterraneum]|uniref:Uncharacterized protein n=1 Tax=Trifolium subterraneum TaxID=3900 RepID=A0A2Z6NYA4_TRISU|nr:hypothetical protein TSUD_170010 [Trifolium subterraneum]
MLMSLLVVGGWWKMKDVAADSTYENILSASHNNTDEEANGCTGLQCRVVVDDEANLFMDQLAAVRSSRMLAGNNNQVTRRTSDRNNPTCSSGGSYTSSSCLGSKQVSHCNVYCGAHNS